MKVFSYLHVERVGPLPPLAQVHVYLLTVIQVHRMGGSYTTQEYTGRQI
jgi:hypothetical protein